MVSMQEKRRRKPIFVLFVLSPIDFVFALRRLQVTDNNRRPPPTFHRAHRGAPFEEYPDTAWQKVMDLNVRGIFNLTKLLLEPLTNGGKAGGVGDPARVVNISSVDGVRASQTFGPTAAFAYTVSKGAVNHLTHALCRALSQYNISVNAIAPGMVPSNMTKFVLSSDVGNDMMSKANPLKRVGRTADMAGAALFLTSPAGAWVNGVIIPVDGGGVVHDSALMGH